MYTYSYTLFNEYLLLYRACMLPSFTRKISDDDKYSCAEKIVY